MSRQAVRGIVIKDNQLLVMHRNKFGTEYDTLPGGKVEIGETHEQALLREIAEETSVTIGSMRLVFMEEAGDPYGTQFIFLCEYKSGVPKLASNSEEAQINKLGNNLYEPKWLPLSELTSAPFVSQRLQHAILNSVKAGFPDQAQQIR